MDHFASIIIPARNESKWILSCLNAIKHLDFPKNNLEVLVIDNGSNDDTIAIAKKFGATVYSRPELRIAQLRNYGAKVARGSIFAFIDADVVVERGWLLAAISCLDKHPKAGCVGCFPDPPEELGWVAKSWSVIQKGGGKVGESEVEWLPSMNIVVKKEAFNKVKGFSTSLITCEDVDFCYRLGEHYEIIQCPDMRAVHNGEPRSLKHLFAKEKWRGLSNYDGLKQHGFRMGEVPSLLIPIYYVVLALWFLIAVVNLNKWNILINACLWFIPPIAKACLSARRAKMLKLVPSISICYFVYCIARTVSQFDWLKEKLKASK